MSCFALSFNLLEVTVAEAPKLSWRLLVAFSILAFVSYLTTWYLCETHSTFLLLAVSRLNGKYHQSHPSQKAIDGSTGAERHKRCDKADYSFLASSYSQPRVARMPPCSMSKNGRANIARSTARITRTRVCQLDLSETRPL